jgi:glycosyltransferase involved in cell wall biosynthesis
MASGGLVIVRGTPTNLEVISDAGLAYDEEDGIDGLASVLRQVIADPALRDRLRAAARQRVATVYSWARIIDDYETLFSELVGRPRPAPKR